MLTYALLNSFLSNVNIDEDDQLILSEDTLFLELVRNFLNSMQFINISVIEKKFAGAFFTDTSFRS